ncbi:hypothetical protein DFH06DRAFT_1188604 [Mycena polygramma]|nr:hypothetical protein DFH06DRAFT_1188604 [Mycena polygramma]
MRLVHLSPKSNQQDNPRRLRVAYLPPTHARAASNRKPENESAAARIRCLPSPRRVHHPGLDTSDAPAFVLFGLSQVDATERAQLARPCLLLCCRTDAHAGLRSSAPSKRLGRTAKKKRSARLLGSHARTFPSKPVSLALSHSLASLRSRQVARSLAVEPAPDPRTLAGTYVSSYLQVLHSNARVLQNILPFPFTLPPFLPYNLRAESNGTNAQVEGGVESHLSQAG